MTDIPDQTGATDSRKWYEGISRYQWTVLVIASLGWVFDIFEGQIFVASMRDAMPSLAGPGAPVTTYNSIALGAFLLGGAVGGIAFGVLSDRIGRVKTMSLTILFYSLFTCLSAFSMAWWHLAAFRFFVAIGVGGEWAVASALVAEVFPQRARARVSGIFHASSVFGTYLAVAAGVWIVGNPAFKSEAHPDLHWRLGFVVGVLPAFLILWIRRSLKEPESWNAARERASSGQAGSMGRIGDLFKGDLARGTLVGVTLAAVGLATFWGAHIFGKDMMTRDAAARFVPIENAPSPASEETRREWLRPVFADAAEDVVAQAELESWQLPDQSRREDLRKSIEDLYARQNLMDARLEESVGNAERTSRVVAFVPMPGDESDAGGPPPEREVVIVDAASSSDARFASATALKIRNRIQQRIKNWEMFGMLLATTGGGLGLLAFGPICERIGRRPTFLFYHLGGLAIALVTFQFVSGIPSLIVVLPVFGFLTLGMHAGYAIYFPELYPTRLRGTGAGFCFNAARIVVPPMLVLNGLLVDYWDFPKEDAFSITSLLYLVGAAVLLIAPETKGRELPE